MSMLFIEYKEFVPSVINEREHTHARSWANHFPPRRIVIKPVMNIVKAPHRAGTIRIANRESPKSSVEIFKMKIDKGG
jgi:hypothetical protein